MYTVADIRKGLKIELEDAPYEITDFHFNKTAMRHGHYVCKLKNILTGATQQRTFRQNDKIGTPDLEERTLTYSYAEGGDYIFMNENFEQVTINAEVLGNGRFFLTENIEVVFLYYRNKPIEAHLPFFIEKEIIETEPGARGNTATNVLKSAKIAGGYELSVPLFVNVGDVVKIDTRTEQYVDRVRKA